MYRSVQESQGQTGKGRRALYWLEGVIVGVVVFIGITFLFGLLSY